MATVYKRRRRKPIPEGAELKTFRKRKVAEWTDARGQRRRAELTDDGAAIMLESEHYTVEYFDHDGERKRKGTRIADKDAAIRYANSLEEKACLRRDGLIDARQERLSTEGRRKLEDALKDFEAKMRAAGRDEKHITSTAGYIRKIAKARGFDTISSITADGVNAFAEELGKSRSARTVQAHLTAMKGLTRWLARDGKLAADPLASVSKPNPRADRRHERRMLLPDEWPWLRSITLTEGITREGMAAAERAVLYATAIQTGLRAGELRSITRRRLYLDGAQPYITCAAGATKNAKDARQYVQPSLAAELKDHIGAKSPKAPVFAMPEQKRTTAALRADLAAARSAWIKAAKGKGDPQEHLRREQSDFLTAVNHEGEHLDFHSLRHTCGAWLAMNGAHPNTVKAIMRHSTITLTMDTYGHLFPGSEADAVLRLPEMTKQPEGLKLVGSDDCGAPVATENTG